MCRGRFFVNARWARTLLQGERNTPSACMLRTHVRASAPKGRAINAKKAWQPAAANSDGVTHPHIEGRACSPKRPHLPPSRLKCAGENNHTLEVNQPEGARFDNGCERPHRPCFWQNWAPSAANDMIRHPKFTPERPRGPMWSSRRASAPAYERPAKP